MPSRKLAVTGFVTLLVAVAVSAAAQSPGGIPILPGQFEQEPVSKSDQHRIVGKVLQIDREQGSVKLATDQGEEVVVQPAMPVVRAIKVGDTISVPRSAAEPSASPRE